MSKSFKVITYILVLLIGNLVICNFCWAGESEGKLKGDQLKGISLMPLEKDTVIQGIYFRKGTCLRLTSEGRVFDARIYETHVIDGENYYEGTTIYFDERQKVSSIRLGRDQVIDGIEFKNDTVIHFNQDGSLGQVILGRDQVIQQNDFIKGTQVYFDQDGNLSKAYPFIEGQEIRGYKVRLRWPVTFYPSGAIYSLSLAENQIIDDIPSLAGDFKYAGFYESGRLKEAFVAEDTEISGIQVPELSKITLYESGQMESLLLSRLAQVHNRIFGRDCLITFDEEGQIDSVNENCGYFSLN
jgi:hypothetical protein